MKYVIHSRNDHANKMNKAKSRRNMMRKDDVMLKSMSSTQDYPFFIHNTHLDIFSLKQ